MPLVNVIRGERIDPAPLHVRPPAVRIPLWMAVVWAVCKTIWVLACLAVRYWWASVPAVLIAWLYVRFDWPGPVLLVGGTVAVCGAWWLVDRPSFLRFGWWPLLGRIRRALFRRRWHAAMATAGLAVSFDGRIVLPILKRVRCTGTGDLVTVRMVTGQIPDDFAAAAVRLAHTFRVRAVKAMPGRRHDLVVLSLLRGDPLRALVGPLPVASTPDFYALPVALREDGEPYELRLFGTQVLVVGATGSGKGSVIWSFIRALAGGIASGLVQVWAFDPKGGMELGAGMPLFARFACDDYPAMAAMLEEAVSTMRQRATRLRGKTRQHLPTIADPVIVIVIDELAALTAYLADRQTKERIRGALGVLLTQGRAVGVHVLACLQDPRKDVLPFRDLFPTRIGLRLSEQPQVDLVLGEGSRDRGALCDRIPQTSPGIAFVTLDGDPTPMRVRFSYLDDDDIRELAQTYGRTRVIDGETLDGAA